MPLGQPNQTFTERMRLGEQDDFSFDMAPWFGRNARTASNITVVAADANITISDTILSTNKHEVRWTAKANTVGKHLVTVTGTASDGDTEIVLYEYEVTSATAI